jgi:small subunit ribosomal protein S17
MPRRVLSGKVVSDKNDKTITVLVERRIMHPVYKKFIRRTKRFMAHDEDNRYKVGDLVSIIESRPMSRRKRWEVVDQGGDGDRPVSGPEGPAPGETGVAGGSGEPAGGTPA